MIHLREVVPSDAQFLYEMLSSRPAYMNISHHKMPSWADHVTFIRDNPYAAWYVVIENTNPIGTAYLTKQDEIGIHLQKSSHGKGYGRRVVAELMKLHPRKRFIANISPNNGVSIAFFENLGFKHIQNTYEYRP